MSGLTGSQVNPSAFPDVVGGQMWQNRDKPMPGSFHVGGTSAYANVNGKDVVYVTDEFDSLLRYTVHGLDPASDTWQQIGRRTMGGESGAGAAAIDSANKCISKR